jgi:hypothetical protein
VNAAGTSAATSVTLTVTAAASGGSPNWTGHSGGSGAMDDITLLALAGLGMTGWFRGRRRAALEAGSCRL